MLFRLLSPSNLRDARRHARGFTLIELLVVIAIIGILSSIVLANLGVARVKGRDVQRIATLKEVQKALEMYAIDNGHYPIVAGAPDNWASFDAPIFLGQSIVNPAATNLSQALAPYIKGISDPNRPNINTAGYLYKSSSSGDSFCVLLYRVPENMYNYSSTMRPFNRCPDINANGKCLGEQVGEINLDTVYVGNGVNAVYISNGVFPAGC